MRAIRLGTSLPTLPRTRDSPSVPSVIAGAVSANDARHKRTRCRLPPVPDVLPVSDQRPIITGKYIDRGALMFWKKPERQTVFIDGQRERVRVGSHVHAKDSGKVLGDLDPYQEYVFQAVLDAQPPNEWNPTPVWVWVNGYHVGWIIDEHSPRYWKTLREAQARDVYAWCEATWRNGKLRLTLPERIVFPRA